MATALLVIDMQNFFLAETFSSLPKVLRLISHFHSTSHPIIFTQHGHTKSELTPPFQNQLVKKWGKSGSIAQGTKQWELIPEIAEAAKGYPVVAKNSFDAFVNTGLEERLRGKGVERVVVCGVLTDCCCDTTAKSAFNRGFETLLVGDACGAASKMFQEKSLQVFGKYYDRVVDTEEALKMMG